MTPEELQPQVLQGLFEKYGTLDSPLAQFFPAMPNTAPGASIMYDVYAYNKHMARLTSRAGPAPRMDMPIRQRVNFEGITMKQSIEPDVISLLDHTAPGSLTETGRERLVANAVRQIRLNQDRRLEWIRAQWLTGGALLTSAGISPNTPAGTIYLDYGATALASPLSVSAGFSTTHIDAAVAASWATTSTNIRADLDTARLLNLADSGVDTRLVMLNSATMEYVMLSAKAIDSELVKGQIATGGQLKELWGYEFFVYDGQWMIDSDTMADTAAEMNYYVPTNAVIITSRDNTACGRELVECAPSDQKADPGSRGIFAWEDESPVHPHAKEYGLEWTGCPVIKNPDSTYIYTDVTAT